MHKSRDFFGKWKSIFQRRRQKAGADAGQENRESTPWVNPYLAYSRAVIETVLEMRGLDYRRFRPILIDTDCPGQVFGEEDDVDQVLAQLEDGLNFLEICTDRPDYFTDWKDYMEAEYGLIVRIVPKSRDMPLYGNMVLDFERNGEADVFRFPEDVIYLPFQKRKWEEDCLDIKVPIGYNMLTVRAER